MMRWISLGLLVVVLSAGATFLAGVVPLGGSDADEGSTIVKPRPANDGPPGHAALDSEPTHDFGLMAQMSFGDKTWMLKNTGKGDLTLTKGPSTCSCTIANLAEGEKAVVKPGEETPIKLSWETRMNNGDFEKSATILVANDPNLAEIRFTVKGKVRPAVVTVPPEPKVNLGTVPNDEPRTVVFAVGSPSFPDMKIESIKVTRPQLIKAEFRPLTDDERQYFEFGGGYKVDVTVTPGTIETAFAEDVIVKTDHPQQREVVLSIQGRIVGPITIVPDRIVDHSISARDGGTENAVLWVRGRDETKFTVEKAPENVKVTIRADDEHQVASDKDADTPRARGYKMAVTVPPGTPPGRISGTIVLKTDHPNADTVRIPVEFLVLERP